MLNEQRIAERATEETIVSLDWWNERLLTFKTTRSPNYSFVAGQYARLGLRDANGVIWRAYSMTSGPDETQLEFYGIIVTGGLFTGRLKTLNKGDRILIEKQPYGFMTPDRFTDGDDLWMISTGTGIGPYLSMLRDPYVWQKFRNLVLVHCVRHADEFAYGEVLSQFEQSPPPNALARLKVIRLATRETESGPVAFLPGRITTLLENGALEQAAGLPLCDTASRIMLCGNPEMIDDMRTLLHARGLRPVRRALPGHFVTENYW